MINLDVFLLGLLISSTLTSLVTEAVKKVLAEYNLTYHANTLTGMVALVVSTGIGCGYLVMADIGITSQVIVCLIAQVVMSWLCAMIGYDKVIQTIAQFKMGKEKEE